MGVDCVLSRTLQLVEDPSRNMGKVCDEFFVCCPASARTRVAVICKGRDLLKVRIPDRGLTSSLGRAKLGRHAVTSALVLFGGAWWFGVGL